MVLRSCLVLDADVLAGPCFQVVQVGSVAVGRCLQKRVLLDDIGHLVMHQRWPTPAGSLVARCTSEANWLSGLQGVEGRSSLIKVLRSLVALIADRVPNVRGRGALRHL